MEVNINSVSRMSAAELGNAVEMKVSRMALDAAETKGTQMLMLIDAASLPPVTAAPAASASSAQSSARPPAPNATTGVMLDTYA
ncbi:MAG: hypothetical protein ACWA5X_12270 [bacterium]